MAWSTRQLADLTGVTLRSIRHWHDIGLLPEPERRSNGYKQYTSSHLVLALRIARLTGLGFSLEQVARMLRSEEHGEESLRVLRTELDTRIAALERIRSEVDDLLGLGISPDVSPEALLAMEVLGRDTASRNVAIVLAHLMPREDTLAFVEALRDAPEEFLRINEALMALPADADDAAIADLADHAATTLTAFLDVHDGAIPDPVGGRPELSDAGVLSEVITEYMNSAQRRAMQRIVEHLA
ncbi:helix-turn-helix domain-containing protein [Agromyces silvae]|uniref:helix-turn-helix domain-containing protein n=1 Tax=Agromyces silvae TaxID=3388266 RepID=UPI00280C1E64|nr:MerR family transcriptional regulator [Agromyces protaetiae]